jgi:redox-sensitive bicupin YhaK (pirin superfamily)
MSSLPHDDPRCVDENTPMIDVVIAGKPRAVDSITVARILPAPQRRMVGPFIFVDHMGPVTVPPGVGFDVRPHPHIGLSTVTYFLEGENVHRDSLGSVQKNVPGDVNVMTAGRGVVHSERADPEFRARGGVMHGMQIWLALPLDHEDDAPSFEHHPKATLPEITPAAGAHGRVLLGEAWAARSPIVHPSQPLLVDLELEAGTQLAVPEAPQRGVFVIEGEIEIDGAAIATDQLAVLNPVPVRLRAPARSRVLILGGAAVGERFIEWNFVASSKERIARASVAWRARQFPTIPGDDQEFIPLPEPRH